MGAVSDSLSPSRPRLALCLSSAGGRARWGSRLTFLLAAIGSAVGLGNVWRFPYMAYKFGGGAFLVPYGAALFLVGLPLSLAELSLGQVTQRGALDSMRVVHPRAWGVGAAMALGPLIVVFYYNVILAWAWVYFFYSFRAELPWAGGRDAAVDFYFRIIGAQDSTTPCDRATAGDEGCPCGDFACWDLHNGLGTLQMAPTVGLLVNWLAVWLCVRGGTETVGKASKYTMPLPFVIMIILFFRAMTLDGAGLGLQEYVVPKFGKLLDLEIWLEAMSQIFFSLSIAQGIMIAYGSFCEKSAPVKTNTLVIAFTNCGFSVFAGLVVFGVIGFLAKQEDTPVSAVVSGGTGLAFVVFPAAIDTMPASPLFAVLFFIMLLTLGVCSAFALLEAFNTVLYDRVPWCDRHKSFSTLAVCFFGFLVGLLMTTNGGVHILDIFDHYLSDFLLVIVGFAECICVGWAYPMAKLGREVERHTGVAYPRVFQVLVRFVTPAIISVLFVFNLVKELMDPFGDYPAWANGVGYFLVLICVAVMAFGYWKPLKAPHDEKAVDAAIARELGADAGASSLQSPETAYGSNGRPASIRATNASDNPTFETSEQMELDDTEQVAANLNAAFDKSEREDDGFAPNQRLD